MIPEAVALAKNATQAIGTMLADHNTNNSDKQSYREALVDSQIALGYVAIGGLPEYRDESLLAFSSAIDTAMTAGSSSTGQSFELLGSPLIRILTGRSKENDMKLAVEERAQKALMSRFAEGALALQFGPPEVAASEFSTAVQLASSAESSGFLKASEMLQNADGFDTTKAIVDTARSFEVLSEVHAKRPEKAMKSAIELLDIRSTGDANRLPEGDRLVAQIDSLQSPLATCAVAMASEAYAAAIPLDDESRAGSRKSYLDWASKANDRTQLLLKQPSLANRYGYLGSLASELRLRLSSPDGYVASVEKLYADGKASEAASVCQDGLVRHSDSSALWKLFIKLQVELARQSEAPSSDLTALIRTIELSANKQLISQFDCDYTKGVIFEQLHDMKSAIGCYESAVAAATEPVERVRALARLSSVRPRYGVATN